MIDTYHRGPRLTGEQIDEAVRLYVVEKWSTDRIGGHFNKNGATIWFHLRRRGVKFRRPGHAPGTRSNVPRAALIKRSLTGAMTIAAQRFVQPSLIEFPPHLQKIFEAEMAKVRAERASV